MPAILRSFTNTRSCYLIITLIMFSSCHKLLQYYNVDPNPAISECLIESINYYNDKNELAESLDFNYDQNGVLVEAIESYPLEEPMEAFTSVWQYRYDSLHRIVWTGPLST